MTVTSTLTKVIAEGNDAATSFSFSPIVIFDPSDLEVTHVDAFGVETVLEIGVAANEYAVVVAKYPGTGSITYPADQVTPLPAGESLVIRRVLPLTQLTNLTNQGPYLAEVQERAYDRLVMIDQQQQEQLSRAVLVPVGSTVAIDELVAALLAAEANAAASAAAAEASAAEAAGSVPALAWLATYDLAGQSAVSITEFGDSEIVAVQLRVQGVTVSNDDAEAYAQVIKNGTIKTASTYHVVAKGFTSADTENLVGAENFPFVPLVGMAAGWGIGNAAKENADAILEIEQPHVARVHHLHCSAMATTGTPRETLRHSSGRWVGADDTAALEGVSIGITAGTFVAGTVLVYGYRDLTP